MSAKPVLVSASKKDRRGAKNRHFPRLCRTCDAPMAGQEDTCWNCGAVWDEGSTTDNEPGVPLGAPTQG
jgi:hypothetical protein